MQLCRVEVGHGYPWPMAGRGERRDGGRRSDGERGRSYQDQAESLMLHDVTLW